MTLPFDLQKAVAALLSQEGETDCSLRAAILEFTRKGEGPVPADLQVLIGKIDAQPWTVTDADFAQLRAAGYSEQQIYEITMCAALGAGLRRFDAGLRAIEAAG